MEMYKYTFKLKDYEISFLREYAIGVEEISVFKSINERFFSWEDMCYERISTIEYNCNINCYTFFSPVPLSENSLTKIKNFVYNDGIYKW